jgi:hypothetical protein
VGSLDAFMSMWATARSTLGEGTPQDGAVFDRSSQLRQMQSSVDSAAPASRWTGASADSYADANSRQGRMLGQMAGLDRRLGAEVDRSAAVVTAGRQNLDQVKQWVLDAAASVPPGGDREQQLMPIARRGIGDVADVVKRTNGDLNAIGNEYRSLGDENVKGTGKPESGGHEPKPPGSEDPAAPNKYEQALRDAGLLSGPSPTGHYKQWLKNAERRAFRRRPSSISPGSNTSHRTASRSWTRWRRSRTPTVSRSS